MAKRKTRVLQARKSDASRDDDSLLMRSAESLGRVIGSLQRQVQDGTKRMSNMADEARKSLPELPELPQLGNVFGGRHKPTRKKAATAPKRAGGARKMGGARKTGAAKRTAGARKRRGSAKSASRRSR